MSAVTLYDLNAQERFNGTQAGAAALVDLGTVRIVSLLAGPQTLYTPSNAYLGDFTYVLASLVLPDHQTRTVTQTTPPVGRAPADNASVSISGVTTSPRNIISSIPLTAGLVTEIDGFFVDAPLAAWQANHAYTDKACILGPDNHIWGTPSAGTSGGTIPNFAGNEGGTVADNTITWTDEGPVPTLGSIHLYVVVIAP